MKRFLPLIAAVAGVVILLFVLPLYRDAQPKRVAITRAEATRLADIAARQVGIPVDRTWRTIIWYPSGIIDTELRHHPKRGEAWDDPTLGGRLDSYRITYYHLDKDKFPPYGSVNIDGRTGEVLSARLRLRAEDAGANATEAQLRPKADAFVRSRVFPAAPSPKFESARSTALRGRTDWVFRYRVANTFDIKGVAPYLYVYFVGDKPAGWDLGEEYLDGRQFSGDNSGDFAMILLRFVMMFVVLLILLVIFLRKYHAGEVGVGAASFLFAIMLVLLIAGSMAVRASASEGTGMGSLDARTTSYGGAAFKILFADIPAAVLLFLAWAVGESYASERWGDRLAAFEAIMRRDAMNATVGRSVLRGTFLAPLLAAAALGIGIIPALTGQAYTSWNVGTANVLFLGGPLAVLFSSASDALLIAIGAVLFVLAWTHRKRVLWLGIIASILLGVVAGCATPPIEPTLPRMLFGFGGIVAAIGIFLGYDLLTAVVAIFGGMLLTQFTPLLTVARGDLAEDVIIALAFPLVTLAGWGTAALLTRREVVYSHEDLAPHVRRIIERERVKAEIDAANRIQAALLPLDTPHLAGAAVASHYRAATEIGGDYFDFLQLESGEIGIAFGDVSGHGLTSGIVMAMAKAALLVQVDHDPSPRKVLDVLNDIVLKTAPKRILMTFFFGVLDPRSQTLRFSSAGHHDPYVFRAASGTLEALSSWGFPLGVKRRDPFREHMVEFEPGDRLVLYSDGLIEAVDDDGEPFGFERFEQVIATNGHLGADDMKKALLNAVRKFTRNRPPEDDQTLVVVAFEDAAERLLPIATTTAIDELVTETVH
ncbi:MAG TPA: PP2C family protein-serine/threonine phosphatase [Thermoanaerobaculia bacterium]|nr:PP2C family protein-serine/threonine phosphatase [Thermoanaerobaculia bacterium]